MTEQSKKYHTFDVRFKPIQKSWNIQQVKTNNMNDKKQLIRVYTGTELTVNLLKEELEKFGIPAMIQNDYNSGISAGFSGGIPSAVDLYIQESDVEKAEVIISEFSQINQG